MEERDVQIRGYKVRLDLDLFVVATANPEDYTSRGRIITPLKDRFGAQIRTHYPEDPETEIAIMEAEWTAFDDETATVGPGPGARLHEGDRGRAVAAGPPLVGGEPALGRERAGDDRQPRDAGGGRAQARRPPGRADRPRRASATCRRDRGLDRRQDRARDARRRDARGAGRREARRSARSSTSSTATSRSPSWRR